MWLAVLSRAVWGVSREVLGLIGAGMSNWDIVARPVIRPHTAKTHVKRVMVRVAA